MTFTLGIIVLLALILIGIPVGFALGLAGVFSLLLVVPLDVILVLMTKVVHGTAANYVMLTIPMFILMAEFLGAGGVAQDLMLSCNRLLRRVRGGMAMACVMAGAVLASASGSSTASAASITRAAFPAMKQAGYAPSFSVGTIAVSGTLAIMIPPSVAFVLYGLMTEVSIGKLFLAGVIPGIMTALGYLLTISLVLWKRPSLGPRVEDQIALCETANTGKIWPIALLIVAILVALYGGIATPTEISAIGALLALIISVATRRMTRASFLVAVGNTLRTTTMIMTIIFSAHLFGYFISFTKITDGMLLWIADNNLPATAVMLMVVVIYLLLGMVMDQAAIIILTAPITTALMVGLGYDPVWWGVVMVKTVEIGLISPPMGLNVFVTSAAAKTDLRSGFLGIAPFLATEFVMLALLIAVPQLSLALLG